MEKRTLTVVQGLPASGKSTWAKEQVRTVPNTVRVNRDLLREMIHDSVWLPQREKGIIEMEKRIAAYYLTEEKQNVIVDDTNLKDETVAMWQEFVNNLQAKGMTNLEFTNHFIDTDVYTCVERDLERSKSVGRHVIYQMALENGMMDEDIHYILVDIDGTLAEITHRRHFVREKPKNWKRFYEELHKDTLRKEVWEQVEAETMKAHEAGKRAYVMLISARPENYRKETEEWLSRVGVLDYTALIMRRAGDSREDSIVKREILHKYFKDKSKIIKVFDDRPRVIRMWREEGLDVVDVGDGVEF